MAYRSDLALVLSEAAGKRLDEKLININSEVVNIFTKYTDYHRVDLETKNRIYYWESVKAYGDEFEFIQLFINGLEDEEFSLLRLGEDHETVGDIEQVGELHCPEFDLRVSAVITFKRGKEIKTKNTNNKLEN
jgi:hypothetical protein